MTNEILVARSEQRISTKFSGVLVVDRQPISIEIVDISRVGACVRGTDLPRRGQEVVLRAKQLDVVATVVWRDDTSCGLNFHKEITPLAIVRENLDMPNLNTLTKAVAMRG
jgi:hypothetical protein